MHVRNAPAKDHHDAVAIVGRPNVGKSAFFNRLTRSRKALVHNTAGVTRDRLYGEIRWGGRHIRLIDTGGLEPGALDVIKHHIEEQVRVAVEEAKLVLFVVDGLDGINSLDGYIADYLRRANLKVIVVVNKVDDIEKSAAASDFYELGFEDVIWVSSIHGLNIGSLLDRVVEMLGGPGAWASQAPSVSPTVGDASVASELPDAEVAEVDEVDDAEVVEAGADEGEDEDEDEDEAETEDEDDVGEDADVLVNVTDGGEDEALAEEEEAELDADPDSEDDDADDEDRMLSYAERPLRVVVAGRPNVGKSSLINYLIKEKRLIVDDQPGTTRGPVDVPFDLGGRAVVLIDTAGIKRRSRKDSDISRLSSATARGAIGGSDIAVLMLDATAGILSQDKHVAQEILENHVACILGINKWDLIEDRAEERKRWQENLEHEFRFLPHATTVYLSAKTGRGTRDLVTRIAQVADCCRYYIPTGRLNQIVREACMVHQPPVHRSGKQLKIRYVSQLKNRPATFVFIVNEPKLMHFSFERYLENTLRRVGEFTGVPLRIIWRKRVSEAGPRGGLRPSQSPKSGGKRRPPAPEETE